MVQTICCCSCCYGSGAFRRLVAVVRLQLFRRQMLLLFRDAAADLLLSRILVLSTHGEQNQDIRDPNGIFAVGACGTVISSRTATTTTRSYSRRRRMLVSLQGVHETVKESHVPGTGGLHRVRHQKGQQRGLVQLQRFGVQPAIPGRRNVRWNGRFLLLTAPRGIFQRIHRLEEFPLGSVKQGLQERLHVGMVLRAVVRTRVVVVCWRRSVATVRATSQCGGPRARRESRRPSTRA